MCGQVAHHEKFDSRRKEFVPCDVPRRVAETILARGAWSDVRYLSGILPCMTILPDGRKITAPGYDNGTGLYLTQRTFSEYGASAGCAVPDFPATLAGARQCVAKLSAHFASFPFVADSDLSAALAGVLTAMTRRVLPSAPLFAVTAPAAGTGKSLLAESIMAIATGARASVLSLVEDDAENEKRLGGALMAGDPALLLDNISHPLGGDFLCQIITQPFAQFRPLGGSALVKVETNVFLIATGNSLQIVRDMKRRTVLIRLDAKIERPERRRFDGDHMAATIDRRVALQAAALGIISAYIASRTPPVDGAAPTGSLEQWDSLVRYPLMWAGLPDPLAASEGLRDQDPELEALGSLLSAWHDRYQARAVQALEVARDSLATGIGGGYAFPELSAALHLVCRDKINSQRLGAWLRAHRDQIANGLRLEHVGKDRNSIASWRVIACG